MATLLEQYELRNDPTLIKRVEAAIAKTAQYVIGAESSETANHRNRTKWAGQAIQQPQSYSPSFSWAVAGNGTIQAAYTSTTPVSQDNVSDSDIEYVVNVTVDIFAGG